jgi:hypothetical protein
MGNSNISLEDEFHLAMIHVCAFAKKYGFGTIFRQMVTEHGGVNAAKRLLAADEVQSGFTRLYELKRLDMSMEAHVMQEQFQSLFTTSEIEVARRRLDEVGFFK